MLQFYWKCLLSKERSNKAEPFEYYIKEFISNLLKIKDIIVGAYISEIERATINLLKYQTGISLIGTLENNNKPDLKFKKVIIMGDGYSWFHWTIFIIDTIRDGSNMNR